MAGCLETQEGLFLKSGEGGGGRGRFKSHHDDGTLCVYVCVYMCVCVCVCVCVLFFLRLQTVCLTLALCLSFHGNFIIVLEAVQTRLDTKELLMSKRNMYEMRSYVSS